MQALLGCFSVSSLIASDWQSRLKWKFVRLTMLIAAIYSIVGVAIEIWAGYHDITIALRIVYSILLVASFFIAPMLKSLFLAALTVTAVPFVFIIYGMIAYEGLSDPVSYSMIVLPMLAAFFHSFRVGATLLLIETACLVVLLYLHSQGWIPRDQFQSFDQALMTALGIALLSSINLALALGWYQISVALFQRMQEERDQIAKFQRFVSLGEMAAGMAHEINNPLLVISLSAQKISREAQGHTSIASESARIESSVKRVARVLRSMMRLSLVEQSMEEDYSLDESLQILEGAVSERIKYNAITYEVNIFGVDEVRLKGDAGVLAQVLVNLVSNAIDAVSDLDAPVIQVNCQRLKSGWVQINVSNNGPIISEEVRERMFDPFYTTKPVGRGTGLGLSVTMAAVRSLNGSLEVDSHQQATVFKITLPTLCNETQDAISC